MIQDILNNNPAPILDLSDKRVLIANLQFIHGIMVASEELLEEALTRPLDGKLRAYYAQHLSEEKNHAEWLADDLRSLGVEPELNWNAAQIAGTQYYLIKHEDPKALLGYMAALECRPMPLSDIEALEDIHGKEALRCIRYHAIHDVDHGQDLLELIDSYEDKDIILKNCEWTAIVLNQAILTEVGVINGRY